jgi:hypothetical protein
MLEDKKCLIGSPCIKCVETCGYRKTYSRDNGQDEKENENERTTKESKN